MEQVQGDKRPPPDLRSHVLTEFPSTKHEVVCLSVQQMATLFEHNACHRHVPLGVEKIYLVASNF